MTALKRVQVIVSAVRAKQMISLDLPCLKAIYKSAFNGISSKKMNMSLCIKTQPSEEPPPDRALL